MRIGTAQRELSGSYTNRKFRDPRAFFYVLFCYLVPGTSVRCEYLSVLVVVFLPVRYHHLNRRAWHVESAYCTCEYCCTSAGTAGTSAGHTAVLGTRCYAAPRIPKVGAEAANDMYSL